jgi:hypothetical protein
LYDGDEGVAVLHFPEDLFVVDDHFADLEELFLHHGF